MSSAARYTVAVAICVLVMPAASCARSGSAATGGRPNVVAAENVWGSIAAQLGGDRVTVTSIIDNPNADPHDYEPTTEDARAMAAANLVIENGVGYDPWAQRLIDANPVSGRHVLDVGTLVGVTTDGNPHRWYSPVGCATGDRRDHARVHEARSGRRFVLRPPAVDVPDDGTRAVSRAHLRDQDEVRRHARRGVGEHLRAHGARPGAEPHHAPELPHRDQRRVGADGGRQGDDRSPDLLS